MAPLKLEINRLNSDELTYELAIRGLVDIGGVDEMRKSFRQLLRLERENPDLVAYPLYPFDFKTDSEAVVAKTAEIRSLVETFDGKEESVHAKLCAKIAFTLNRINRSIAIAPEQQAIKSKLIVGILNLKSKVEKKVRHVTSETLSHTLGVSDLSLEGEAGEESDSSSDSVGSIVLGPAPRVSFANISPIHAVAGPSRSEKIIPVSQWNLKFSGDERDLSLSAFLIRVEEMRMARNVSDAQLFNSAIDLFSGNALTWYRSMRKSARNWKDLVILLRKQFQPADYNDRLFEEIRRRTQGPKEPMGIYLAVMDNLFDRLTIRVPEATRLKLILKNLAPFYQQQLGLSPVRSLDELLSLGLAIERQKASLESYVPPPPKRNSGLLEPDLAYVSTSISPSESISEIQTAERDVALAGEDSRIAGKGRGVCWNCGHSGHAHRQCRAPKNKFCFGCGRPNATIRNCTNCSGNASRGNR